MTESNTPRRFSRLAETPTATNAPVFAPHSWGLKGRDFNARGSRRRIFGRSTLGRRILGWKGTQNLQRFGGWWFSLSAIYATTGGGCPCCGNVGCPVGGAGAGFIGAFLMSLWSRRLKRNHARENTEITTAPS